MKSAFVVTGVAFLYFILGYGYWITIESKTRGSALGAPVDEGPPSDTGPVGPISLELERFRGTWRLVSSETNGRAMPNEEIDGVLIHFVGNHQTVTLGGRVIAHCMKFTIDPTTEPKSTDDSMDHGPFRGRKIRGIYAIDGDRLMACVGPIDGERPTAFESRLGSGWTLREFRRVSSEYDGRLGDGDVATPVEERTVTATPPDTELIGLSTNRRR